MATLFVGPEPESIIDYSLVDGRVREFVHNGERIYDEDEKLDIPGWKDVLVKIVLANKLNVPRDDLGVHAFVARMIDDGLVPLQESSNGLKMKARFWPLSRGLGDRLHRCSGKFCLEISDANSR